MVISARILRSRPSCLPLARYCLQGRGSGMSEPLPEQRLSRCGAFCARRDAVHTVTFERRRLQFRDGCLLRTTQRTPRAGISWLRDFSSAVPLFSDTVIVTKRCAERVNELRSAKEQPQLRLRLAVEGGGCSGFQYKFSLEDARTEEASSSEDDEEDSDDEDDSEIDHEFERDGATVVIDETSLAFVKGATVDFEEDMMRSAFAVVNNPVSESACGCGSSFALKNFEKNPAID